MASSFPSCGYLKVSRGHSGSDLPGSGSRREASGATSIESFSAIAIQAAAVLANLRLADDRAREIRLRQHAEASRDEIYDSMLRHQCIGKIGDFKFNPTTGSVDRFKRAFSDIRCLTRGGEAQSGNLDRQTASGRSSSCRTRNLHCRRDREYSSAGIPDHKRR